VASWGEVLSQTKPTNEKWGLNGENKACILLIAFFDAYESWPTQEETVMSDKERKMKEDVAELFNQVASTYDRIGPRFFSHFGRRLVELAQIPSGADVLDVAAGRGAVLYPAAEQVGLHGHVVGIDLSAEMVRETAAEIKISGLKNATMLQMDAEQLTFPDASFDFVLCGLSIFFFTQLQRALNEFCRVLRPSGRVGVTTFAKDSEGSDWFREILRSYSSQDSQTDEKQKTAAPTLDTPAELEARLSNAGFVSIKVVKEGVDFAYKNEEELWSSLWSHGARRDLEQMDIYTLERFKADVFQKVQVFRRSDGIHVPRRRVLFALGIRSCH
jgi:ubiquinone/menaquinone biosynthesis C-methylase UbiE